MPESSPNISLDPVEILTAEFNYGSQIGYHYIAQSAFQANEDRARVTSFYLVSVGLLMAAILGTQFAGDIQGIAPAFSLLFAFLTLLGTLTISQLARLRAAWYAAVLAMNKIKDYTIEHFPHLDPAFAWRVTSIPKMDKPYSIANLMAVEVALLSTITLGAAFYYLLRSSGDVAWWDWPVIVLFAICGYAAEMTWYKYLLGLHEPNGEKPV